MRKLPPASTAVWQDGALTEETYWTPWDTTIDCGHDWAEDEERLLELITRSTRARMISDVPLGVMLSGGLDSSLITALMAAHSSQPSRPSRSGLRRTPDPTNCRCP